LLVAAYFAYENLWKGASSLDLPEGNGLKVAILGLDAADWKIIRPMVESGRLPNFKTLMDKGATGVLIAREPMWSPALWTTMVTGVRRIKHGITDFAVPKSDPPVPFTSNMRTRKTLWNILSEAGRTVGMINWWVSYPAEPVNGYMVSNYWRYFYHRRLIENEPDDSMLTELSDAVHPASLVRELTGIRPQPVERTVNIDFSVIERHRVDGAYDPSFGLEFSRDSRIFKKILEQDEFVRALGLKLYRERPVDLFGIYFEGIDASCHLFWPYLNPDRYEVTEQEVRDLGGVIKEVYVAADAVLGEYMDMIDSHTILLVCSDHGYGDLPGKKHFHVPEGMIAFYGEPVRQGAAVATMHTEDVGPTVLNLMGYPVAEDMDGRAFTDFLKEPYILTVPASTIPTYETGSPPIDTNPVVSPLDGEVIDQLRALGYLQ